MGYEIERKFIVEGEFKQYSNRSCVIKQGYICISGSSLVRVRLKGDKAYITVKTSSPEGSIKRSEWEYEIPVKDAEEMLMLCEDNMIDKIRYLVEVGSHTFEVDEFYGENSDLLLAEVELNDEDEEFERPDWLGREVTGNIRYYNSFLSIHPFNTWSKEEKEE